MHARLVAIQATIFSPKSEGRSTWIGHLRL
uniref:Uncharacterized protein n=1 Tax=Lotus japonicus TaxID=34305 RepID=I3SED4_LOTJA|nr:unknown [Lotus japonicus]